MSADPAPSVLRWASLVLSLGLGLYGAVFWSFRDQGPPEEAFGPAAQLIRDRYRAGDLIFLVPHFATRAREYLGDLHPLAVRDPMQEDLRAVERVFVFGLFGYAEKLRPMMAAAGHELRESLAPHPGITIDLYELGVHEKIAYRFLDHLRDARVFHEHEGRLEACDRWSDKNQQGGAMGRWICPHDGEWFFVGPEWHRMGDHLRLCLWAHPPNDGRLLIRFPSVPMTGTLYGRAGHTLNSSLFARERIDLDVEVERFGQQRFSFPLEEHWRPFALNVPTSTTATVTFAVSSPDAGANHFCFIADTREP